MTEKLTIFISGTMRNLPTERERVAATIRGMGLEPIWAEKQGATNRPSREECQRMARTCHVYLGLYGPSYGWKFPPKETISATESEWQTAKRVGKPMLIYRQKGQPDQKPDPEQAAFLKKVGDWQQGRFWYEFETLDDLLPRLRDDLARLIAESFRPQRPALLADYRAHLRRLYADLPLSGIPVPLDVTLPLDRVYIKLRVLPEREEAARREAALPSDSEEELPRMLGERLWRRREEWEEAAGRMEEARPIPPEEAIAEHDRLTILGDAGAGKSTLLRHLAWERAGDPEALLPLLIPLGLADVQVSTTGSFLEAALDLLTEHKAGEERELLKQALADAIGEKRVLFLCDGLDEVHMVRRSVIAGLEKLAADGQRLVVTSRPLGYERLAGLGHFQVLPLLPQDAEAFTDRWFRALAQAWGVPEPERERWATERAGWLQRQLKERPGLREVARNPLLLTFLAVLAGDEPQRDLPRRRKELYREYVERLLTVWEARRRQEGELSLGKLRGEEARRVALWGLYCTAWRLHRAYYGEEGLRAVRGEIELLLARDLRERWEIDLLQAESLAAEALRFWEGAGLLDAYRLAGQEWLAFRHLTFQEYGAARTLAEARRDDAEGLWRRLSPHLLRPQWAGVIPLTLAHLSRAQATALVEQLLAANAGDEDRQRPLFLAAAALAEGAEVADGPHRQVVDGLLGIARTRGGVYLLGVVRERASAEDAIGALGRMVGDEHTAAGLLALARDKAVSDWERRSVAAALGRLGRAEELLALAQDKAMGDRVRYSAAAALGRLGRAVEVAETWLALARNQAVENGVRVEAAEALGWLGRAEEAAELLLALARDEALAARVRVWAAEALGRLGWAEEEAEAWLALARDQEVEAGVRERAAAALGRLGRAEEEAEAWLALARDQEVEAWVRRRAAEALGELGQIGEAAELLLALARDGIVVGWVRQEAVKTLQQLGQADDLLALARDQAIEAWVQALAAKALGKLGRAEEAAELLLALARDEAVEARARWQAAEALGQLGEGVPEVLAGLRALAEEPDTPETMRQVARWALERLAK